MSNRVNNWQRCLYLIIIGLNKKILTLFIDCQLFEERNSETLLKLTLHVFRNWTNDWSFLWPITIHWFFYKPLILINAVIIYMAWQGQTTLPNR